MAPPERRVRLRPATGMAPAFAILASNDAAAKVASKNSAAAGVQLFQPLGYHILACHTAIYTQNHTDIYTGPLFWSFLLPESRKVVFFKAGVKGIQVRNNEELVRYSNKHFALHDNISHNYTNAYILLYFWKSFQLCFCPPRMFSSTSALLGLSRSADYSASNANLLLGFVLQIVGGQNRLNSTPRSWKFQWWSTDFPSCPLAQFPGKLQLNLTCIWMSDHT